MQNHFAICKTILHFIKKTVTAKPVPVLYIKKLLNGCYKGFNIDLIPIYPGKSQLIPESQLCRTIFLLTIVYFATSYASSIATSSFSDYENSKFNKKNTKACVLKIH